MDFKGLLPRRVVARTLKVSIDSLVYQEKTGRFKPVIKTAPGKGRYVLYSLEEFAKAAEFYRVKNFTYRTDALLNKGE